MAKERTEEEKTERKVVSKAKRAKKKIALIKVLAFVTGRKNVPDEIKAAVVFITPGIRVGGGGGPSKLKVFTKLFSDESNVPEMKIFNLFKAGRAEMRKICVNMIKKLPPDQRVWVRLDAAEEAYVVEGYGSDAPKGWTGYQPVEIEDTEII